MPTNTTNTTNTTTPLSAMTGEEVASILVGLIRQNDGVLIQQKVTDGINQSPAGTELSQGKAAIVAALQSVGITATTNDTLTVLAAKMLQAIAIINTATFVGGTTLPVSIGQVIANPSMVTAINDDRITSGASLNPYTALRYINMPNLISGTLFTRITSNIEALFVPKRTGDIVETLLFDSSGYIYMNSLRHLKGFTSAVGSAYGMIHMNSLYNYEPCHISQIIVNTNVKRWNPTTALDSNSSTLCTPDEWDDENQPTFANNLQKFLWYFEYHFIPCFGTVTTSPVLSLYTTVWNAINSNYSISDPTKTLRQLLTAKGWEVASVS